MSIPTNIPARADSAGKPVATITPSFARDILPLFRVTDIQNMNTFGVRLGDHSWVSKPGNARHVLNHLMGTTPPRMPLGGPYWTDEQLKKFQEWMNAGYPP
ncbi:MAG TPA: hypothetical protein VN684_10815 [Terriglobales bacterium]|nr:hypothetical protein [Terriglobales bacterium]